MTPEQTIVVWRRPTRRAFVAMLAGAAAALAIRPAPARDPEPSRPAAKTRWIGHI